VKKDRRRIVRKTVVEAQNNVSRGLRSVLDGRARHWIRPPFALDEADFLVACDGCGLCVEACSYDVVFYLPRIVGVLAANTPALDLINRGCHLCADWPCVKACNKGALILPKARPVPLPLLARASIDRSVCLMFQGTSCSLCCDACPVPGAQYIEAGFPVIDPKLCVGCGCCREVCVTTPKAINIESIAA